MICARGFQAEFREMPGLQLTLPQASRLFSIETTRCERVLRRTSPCGALVDRWEGIRLPAHSGADLRDSSTSGHAHWHPDGRRRRPWSQRRDPGDREFRCQSWGRDYRDRRRIRWIDRLVTLASIDPEDVPGILRLGGTILGTTNRRNPLAYPAPTGEVVDYSTRCVDTFHGLDWTRSSSLAATERWRSPTSL